MANTVIWIDTGTSLKHQNLITRLTYKIRWKRLTANKIVRLAKGLECGFKWTNTIRFIRKCDVTAGPKVTYGSFVVDRKEHKYEKERTMLTVGGDKIE
jgi:hypothetical protein